MGLAAFRVAAITPVNGRLTASPTAGIGATPKSMPLFWIFDQAQGPLMNIADSPLLKAASAAL
ncbi:hypothetical protein D3C86_1991740 [compost metagenome]